MAKKLTKKLTTDLKTDSTTKQVSEAAQLDRRIAGSDALKSPALAPPVRPPSEAAAKRLEASIAQMGGVPFVLLEPDAKRVTLSGEFNGWSPEATPMRKDEGGRWTATVALPAGRYQYKFVVDGQWIPDPNAREQAFNPYGTLNSVVEVRA